MRGMILHRVPIGLGRRRTSRITNASLPNIISMKREAALANKKAHDQGWQRWLDLLKNM